MYLRWNSVWQFCKPEQCQTEPPLPCASSWACPAGYSQPTFTPIQLQESTGPTWALLGPERARTATVQSTKHVTVQFKIVEIGEKSFRWTNIQLQMHSNIQTHQMLLTNQCSQPLLSNVLNSGPIHYCFNSIDFGNVCLWMKQSINGNYNVKNNMHFLKNKQCYRVTYLSICELYGLELSELILCMW